MHLRDYTLHKVWRVVDLNDQFFEVVFSKRSLKFVSGCAVTLYNYSSFPPVFIASGVQEPWVRIILDKDIYSDFDRSVDNIKISREVTNLIPSLIGEEHPNFVIDAYGISPFLSYVSTLPQIKCKVCYVGDNRIAEDWIRSYHKLISKKDMRKCDNVYIIGNKDYLNSHVSRNINKAKCVYFV